MAQENKPRDCVELPAVNPSAGSLWNLLLRHNKMDAIALRGEGPARELAYTVPWAIIHPTAIFRGVREEGERNWLCYVSTPSQAYDYHTGQLRRAWPGKIFLVFVSDDRMIYNWRWERTDPQHKDLPENYETRFEERML